MKHIRTQVQESTHRLLKRKAAMRDMTLGDYLQVVLEEHAAIPENHQVWHDDYTIEPRKKLPQVWRDGG
jgi:hypothetical protein